MIDLLHGSPDLTFRHLAQQAEGAGSGWTYVRTVLAKIVKEAIFFMTRPSISKYIQYHM